MTASVSNWVTRATMPDVARRFVVPGGAQCPPGYALSPAAAGLAAALIWAGQPAGTVYRVALQSQPDRWDTGATYAGCDPQGSGASYQLCDPQLFGTLEKVLTYAGSRGEVVLRVFTAQEAYDFNAGRIGLPYDRVISGNGAASIGLAAGGAIAPAALPGASQQTPADFGLTQPAERPQVYQRALNFQLSVNTVPQPLTNTTFPCETIVLDVISTAANSVFFGYGSSVSLTSGIEIRPGLPVALSPDNSREQWELQRSLELIAALLASDRGVTLPAPYKAPRVVFDANDYFVVASATTALSVMLFYVPELQ
jgi:hypothetical protein